MNSPIILTRSFSKSKKYLQKVTMWQCLDGSNFFYGCAPVHTTFRRKSTEPSGTAMLRIACWKETPSSQLALRPNSKRSSEHSLTLQQPNSTALGIISERQQKNLQRDGIRTASVKASMLWNLS